MNMIAQNTLPGQGNTAPSSQQRAYLNSQGRLILEDPKYVNVNYTDVNDSSSLYVQPDGTFSEKSTPGYIEVSSGVALQMNSTIMQLQKEYDKGTLESQQALLNQAMRDIFVNGGETSSWNSKSDLIAQGVLAKNKILFSKSSMTSPIASTFGNTTSSSGNTTSSSGNTTSSSGNTIGFTQNTSPSIPSFGKTTVSAKEQTLAAMMSALDNMDTVSTTNTTGLNASMIATVDGRMLKIQSPFSARKLAKVKKISNQLNSLSSDPEKAVDYLFTLTKKRHGGKIAGFAKSALRKVKKGIGIQDTPEEVMEKLQGVKANFIDNRLSFLTPNNATVAEMNAKEAMLKQIDSVIDAYMAYNANKYLNAMKK